MENAVVKARIDPVIKAKAKAYLDSIGLTVSDLIRMTVIRTATNQALPFDEIPNEETIYALDQSDNGSGVYEAKSFDDLIAQLESKCV